MRYKIVLEYKGIGYHGWQKQKSGIPTIQETVEKSLKLFFNKNVDVYVAGRTDANVHALYQVAHFNIENSKYSLFKIKEGLNFYLKHSSVVCLDVSIVPDAFHARFSVQQKTYMYFICNRRERLTVFKNLAWHVPEIINIEVIKREISFFKGYHDFSSFCSSECIYENKKRTIDDVSVENYLDKIFIRFYSKSFLHNQVRIMVGTLIDISLGRINNSIDNILKSKNRKEAGVTSPPYGLYLENIKY